MEVGEKFIHGHIQLLGHRLQNPQIGLVGDDQIDVVSGQPVSFEGLFGDIGHRSDGLFEKPIAFHGQDIGFRGRIAKHFRQVVVSLDGMEQIPEPAIGLDVGGKDAAVPIPALEHDGSGAVAQQNAGAAVFPVDDGGEPFGSDDQYMLGLAQTDAVVGLLEGVDESRTTGRNIECRRIVVRFRGRLKTRKNL